MMGVDAPEPQRREDKPPHRAGRPVRTGGHSDRQRIVNGSVAMIAPPVIIRRFGESPADDNAAVYGLRSTAARTNELEADERRRIIESEEGSFRGWLLRGVACCPRRWRAEWSRKHPSGVWPCGRADAMTMCSGTGPCPVR